MSTTQYTVTATNIKGSVQGKFSLTIIGTPTIVNNASGNWNTMQTVLGTPSPIKKFFLTGTNLYKDVVLTSPDHFEISKDSVTFSNTLTLPSSDGNFVGAPVKVFVRLTGDQIGGYESTIGINTQYMTSPLNLGVYGTVTSPPPSNLSYSPNPVIAIINTTTISSVPTVTGTIDSYSISPTLPTGVTLNTTSGIISGKPSVISPATDYTVTATNTLGSTTAKFTLTVNGLPIIIPGHNSMKAFSTTQGTPSEAQYFTVSGDYLTNDVVVTPTTGYEISKDSVSYSTSITLPQSDGNVVGEPVKIYTRLTGAAIGTFNNVINLTSTGAASNGVEVSGSVVAPPPAPTNLSYAPTPVIVTVNTTSISSSPTVTSTVTSYTISPALPTGVTINKTTGVISGIPLAVSPKTDYTVTATNGGGNTTATFTLTVKTAAPSQLTYSPNPVVSVVSTTNVSASPSVIGTVDSYSISPALPTGITIDATSGVISGTPSVISPKATYTVTATNSIGSTTTPFVLTVNPKAPDSFNYFPNEISVNVNSDSIKAIPTYTSVVDTFYVSPDLLPGVKLNPKTGVIYGVPTVVYPTVTYTVTAKNATGTTTTTFKLTVNDVPPTNLSYSPSPVNTIVKIGTVNATPSVKGNVTNYTISPALPTGVNIDPTSGVISGTPTVISAKTDYTVTATNPKGNTTGIFTLAVKNLPTLSTSNGVSFVAIGNASGITTDPQVKVSAEDSTLTFNSATVSITGNLTSSEDALVYSTLYGVSGVYNSTNGVLTLTGMATVAQYQNIFRSIKYKNSNAASVVSNRTITFTLSSTVDATISASKVVRIVTTPPTLATSSGVNSLTAGTTTANVIDANLTVTSTNSGSTLDNATVFINSGFVSTEDKLIYPSSLNGVTGTYNSATGVLLLSGTATIAQYQEIFRTIQYQNTNATTATAGVKSFTFSLGNAIQFTPCGATVAHYYDFIPNSGITWTDAKVAAEAKTYFGLQGYLSTIMCAEENNFAFKSIGKKGWIGASDAALEGDWYWVTGPEAGTLFFRGQYPTGAAVGGYYNNWDSSSEPNNNDYAHFLTSGKWNDYANTTSVDGYYIEYGGMSGDLAISISGVKNLNITLTAPTANPTQAVCGSGTVADLVATARSGSSVRWYSVATGGTALVSSSALATGTYYAESWNGVSASPTRTAVVLIVNVIPAQPIIVPTSTAKNKIKLCPGDNIVCSNFDNTLSYQWKLNGNNLTGQTTNQYKVPASGAGIYTLYVKNPTTGCDISSANVTVDVYTVTTPVIYEKKKSDYISILVVDNRQNLYSSYLWTYADGTALPSTIVNDRQFLVLPPANMAATYMVNITDTNACKITSAIKAVTLKTIAAKAYPSISNGNFMVSLTDAQDGKLNVRIFNQNGILQKVYSFDNVSSEFEYQINASGLRTGSYTVEISLGDYKQTQKIIIQ
jgi:hypothetical protein